MALLAQLHVYYRRENGWPTLRELAVFTELPVEQVQRLVDILVDRRYVRVEGETIYPWEAGPSPVVTYRLSPEEIAARYGPPARPGDRAEARRQVAGELLGCWPERSTSTTAKEESERMPTGQRVNWPDPRELVAMADELTAEGRSAAAVIAARLGVSPATVRKKLQEARHVVTLLQLKEDGVLAPEETTDTPDPGEAPSSADVMVEAEAEANRLVEASDSGQDARSEATGTPTSSKEETPASGPQDASEQGDLRTFQHLILVSPTEVRVELVHITMAPEMPGDEWPEIVRVDGRRQVRIWSCIGVQRVGDQPVAVMTPKGYALARVHDVHERRTA